MAVLQLPSLAGAFRRRIMAPRFRMQRHDHPAQRQLLVDVSTIIRSDVRTGIQRVVRSLLGQLTANPVPGITLQPVFCSRNHGFCKAIFRPDGTVVNASADPRGRVPVHVSKDDVFLGLDLAAQTLPAIEGELAAWRRLGVSVNMLVYDLLPLSNPEWFSPSLVRNFERWVGFLARQSDRCICISETVAASLAGVFAGRGTVGGPTIMTIPLGADMEASYPSRGRSENDRDIKDFLRGRRALLAVGTIEPRKGHRELLDALDHLWQSDPGSDIALILAGRAGWKTEQLQARINDHSELGRRLMWVSQASDEVLSELYHSCSGLVSASYQEGFGLPLIEAAAYGAPILARDIPVFREVGGSLFSYFDDDAPEPLSARIKQWLATSSSPSEAERRALPSWADSATALLAHLGFSPKSKAIAL